MKQIYDNIENRERINLIIENCDLKKLTIQVRPDYINNSYSENGEYTEDDIDIETYLTLDNYHSHDFLVTGEVLNYQIINN